MANVVPQLDFKEAVKLAYSRLKETKGRSRRSEFWWTMLAVGVGGGLIGAILGLIPDIGILLKSLVYFAVVFVTVPLMMRRFHDIGKDGLGLIKAYIIITAILIVLSIITYYAAWTYARDMAFALSRVCILVAIPLLVVVIIIVIFCVQDSQGNNAYGPSPKYPDGK